MDDQKDKTSGLPLNPFDRMSNDSIKHIFTFLERSDLCNLRLVAKTDSFAVLSAHDDVWERRLEKLMLEVKGPNAKEEEVLMMEMSKKAKYQQIGKLRNDVTTFLENCYMAREKAPPFYEILQKLRNFDGKTNLKFVVVGDSATVWMFFL